MQIQKLQIYTNAQRFGTCSSGIRSGGFGYPQIVSALLRHKILELLCMNYFLLSCYHPPLRQNRCYFTVHSGSSIELNNGFPVLLRSIEAGSHFNLLGHGATYMFVYPLVVMNRQTEQIQLFLLTSLLVHFTSHIRHTTQIFEGEELLLFCNTFLLQLNKNFFA